MGKAEREAFRIELEKNHRHTEDNDAFWEQNSRTAEAEKKCNWVENLWVRGQVDD